MSKQLTSVIDVPRKAGQVDLFGIDKYKDALVEFIETTSTPITVAIQGEWGSGKTSLMNTLKDELCDKDGKKFHPIWLNTWQFSLMKSEEETLISIINGLTNEIADIVREKDSNLGKLAKKSLSILGKIAGASVKVAVNAATGQDVGEVVDAFSNDARDTTILKLRDSLNELIRNIIQKDSNKDGFIFFIDDLDRIDPPVAVNILELLKNIFDLENCVFVLAIDYDVVVKGLEPKFGKLTDKNEREFRSFFDKIIQLPFSMPVSSYNIDVFLEKTLEKINYIPSDKTKIGEFYESLTDIAYNSVGSNPRSLKRLINTISLISIINKRTGIESKLTDTDKQINFALVCLQVAYPTIYKSVNMDTAFTSWDEETARKLKLRKLEEHEIKSLSQSTEFDDEWEQVLYRICEKDTYLESRVYNISLLLNRIADLVPEGTEFGEYISEVMQQSSVTDVQAGDKPKEIKVKTSDYLKVIKEKITPLLLERIKEYGYDMVEQQNKRVISNLYLKYTEENNKPYTLYEIRPNKSKPFIDVGTIISICDYDENQNIEDLLNASGKKAIVENIKKQFTKKRIDYQSQLGNVGFWRNPNTKGFYRGKKGEKLKMIIAYRIFFNNVEDVISNKYILAMADISTDMLKYYNELNK